LIPVPNPGLTPGGGNQSVIVVGMIVGVIEGIDIIDMIDN
jgi:hypothetical protein